MCGQYPSDVTDGQWEVFEKLLPAVSKVGRPPLDRRRVLDAIFYLNRTGCQWRQLPHDFPKWQSVYTIFRRWRLSGVWQRIHDALRQMARKAAGKAAEPTTGIVDSQSIRTAEGGDERGHDAGKQITGRKRHIVVDTMGLILAVVVHAASWQDQDGACCLMAKLAELCPRLRRLFADSAYGRSGLPDWVKKSFGWVLNVVKRPEGSEGFVVLPKRWIVERTFAWLVRCRRHSRDYERNSDNSEAMIHITMIQLMSRRLANTRSV